MAAARWNKQIKGMMAFEQKELLLLLLFPYAVLVIWGLRKFALNKQATLVLWAMTVIVVWELFYGLYVLDIFYDPKLAFAPMEYIMRDVNVDWLLRYLSEHLGGLLASVYFSLCWIIARMLPQQKKRLIAG